MAKRRSKQTTSTDFCLVNIVMKETDYIQKMLHILDDTSKFHWLGPCTDNDNTARIEWSIQDLLGKLRNASEVSEAVYQDIRPTGATPPRMCELPKVHKEDVQLRPILSMMGSPQHATAQWLATVLKPVSLRYSEFTLKDSFTFSDSIRELNFDCSAQMCYFDIKSLFTIATIEETIQICMDQLYDSDIQPPQVG